MRLYTKLLTQGESDYLVLLNDTSSAQQCQFLGSVINLIMSSWYSHECPQVLIKMIPANQSSLPPRLNNNGCHFLGEALFLAYIIPISYSDLSG